MSRAAPTWAVVLAGGVGSRLWPASRPDRPKQLLPLGQGGRPLVADALERAKRLAGPGRVLLVASRPFLASLRGLLSDLDPACLLREPSARGTAPALLLAAHRVVQEEPDAMMVSLHADHRIAPAAGFDRTLRRTLRAAAHTDWLFCVGAPPDRPETGYGYLRLGRPLQEEGGHEVERFEEKPDASRARRYLASGGHLWNTGLFVWRAATFLRVARERSPELAPHLPLLETGRVEEFFERVEPVSVDVAVMERAPAVGTVEADFEWDDLGVWTAVGRTLPTDAGGNACLGEVRTVASQGNVVWSEDGRIVLFGVEDLVVVRSGGRTLVTTRERAPDLKELLARLEEEGPP